MASFTKLDQGVLSTYFEQLGIGEKFKSAEPVQSGVENTTYRIRTDADNLYYFSLFEHIKSNELKPYVGLLHSLLKVGLPVPAPMFRKEGGSIGGAIGLHYSAGCPDLKKPWVICPAIKGVAPSELAVKDCSQIGDFLGRLHLFVPEVVEPLSQLPWEKPIKEMKSQIGRLTHDERVWCTDQLERAKICESSLAALPKAICHGDLFPDNTLFVNGTLSGVIDFFNAYYGPRVYDLAVVINAWCVNPEDGGCFDQEKVASVLSAYQQHIQLSEAEKAAFQAVLLLAAFRFWISRKLWLWQYPDQKEQGKDPLEYYLIVEAHLRPSVSFFSPTSSLAKKCD